MYSQDSANAAVGPAGWLACTACGMQQGKKQLQGESNGCKFGRLLRMAAQDKALKTLRREGGKRGGGAA